MKPIVVIDLDRTEKGLVVNALFQYRNDALKKHIDTYDLDKLIVKILDAPMKEKMYPKTLGEER